MATPLSPASSDIGEAAATPQMINKKICMLGAFAVGKTALVQKYVHSIFSDVYQSSIGVKISKKTISSGARGINLMLWDLEGHDDYSAINLSYLKGAMGLLIVADGTKGDTLSVALTLRSTALSTLGGDLPNIVLLNKADLTDQWEISDKAIQALRDNGVRVIKTSAKNGVNVDQAFTTLTMLMMENQQP